MILKATALLPGEVSSERVFELLFPVKCTNSYFICLHETPTSKAQATEINLVFRCFKHSHEMSPFFDLSRKIEER